nr:hypothetical protein GTC16762_10010 [Pigmentibacter ruber]
MYLSLNVKESRMRSFRYDDLEMQNLNIKEDNINDTIRYTPSNTIRLK